MSTTVHFTQKNGQPGQATFPSRALAEKYARTVRNARLVDSTTAVAPVEVQHCPDGTAERQRAATRAHYSPKPARASAEHAFEREAEFWGASRAAGQSAEEAWRDYDFVQRRSGR